MRAILFDLDGVLVQSREAWFPLVQAAALHFGSPPPSRETFERTFGQGVDADIEHFFPGRSPGEVERFYVEGFAEHGGPLEVDPDAARVLIALRARGVPHAVVTNTPAPLARVLLERAGLEVAVVVGAGMGLRDKPAPDLLQAALAKLGIADPGEAVMVGDSRFDREAAEAARVPFVGYGIEGPRRVERLGDLLTL